jgi:hypothetical protein
MNGPAHYPEAERLIGLVEGGEWVDTAMPGGAPEVVSGLLATAQVHATLALAAATASSRTSWANPADSYTATYVDGDWSEVIA